MRAAFFWKKTETPIIPGGDSFEWEKRMMTPSFEILMKMVNAGEQLTSAHAYALRAVRVGIHFIEPAGKKQNDENT